VISARYFNIPLTEVKPAYHQGRIDAQRIDENATLYLGVSADLAGTELVEVVPRTFKVGAPDVVEQLVSSSMPGVSLTYMPQVPAAIPVRPGMLYFAIEPRGGTYEHMRMGQTVMVFVPNGVSELKLELIALTS
jgi:type VI secretion system protein ImpJ